MRRINKSMQISELGLRPPIDKAILLSEDMQQTLALLTGTGNDERKLLRASESGILNTVSARISEIVHYTGSGANDTQQGASTKCTEVMIMGHPDNTGKIWVCPYTTATVDNSWPLAANDAVSFALDNLKQLNMLIVVSGEKVIVAYTR